MLQAMDPISAIPAGINTVIKILEITYYLKAVDEQTRELLATTKHVNSNIHEARRLRRLKDNLLQAGERLWMDGVIKDTEAALQAVAQLIEPARVNLQTHKRINLKNRAIWVFRDNAQVRDKHARLSTCHQTLTAVISCLYSRDVVVITPVPEERDINLSPPHDSQLAELYGWRSRRRRNKSARSPSTTAEDDSLESVEVTSSGNTLYSFDSHSSDSCTSNPLSRLDSRSSYNSMDSTTTVSTLSPYSDIDGLQAWEDYLVGPSRKTLTVDLSGLPAKEERLDNSALCYDAVENCSMEKTCDSDLVVDHALSYSGWQSYNSGVNHLSVSSNNNSEQDCNSSQSCQPELQATSEQGLRGGHGSAARGRNSRSWLAYHATRSDIGHSSGMSN